MEVASLGPVLAKSKALDLTVGKNEESLVLTYAKSQLARILLAATNLSASVDSPQPSVRSRIKAGNRPFYGSGRLGSLADVQ